MEYGNKTDKPRMTTQNIWGRRYFYYVFLSKLFGETNPTKSSIFLDIMCYWIFIYVFQNLSVYVMLFHWDFGLEVRGGTFYRYV